jgi:branched-chain amino acid transport system substrate-binding protein
MMIKRHLVYVFALLMGLGTALGDMAGAATAPEKAPLKGGEVSYYGFEGNLRKIPVPDVLQAVKDAKFGQPPFLKVLDAGPDCGIRSSVGGVLQRGNDQVQVFKLQFESEDLATASINLKKTRLKTQGSILQGEDPQNCRNCDFGLFFDKTQWSGYRRDRDVVALIKGKVSQEEIFHLMTEVLPLEQPVAATASGPIKIGLMATFQGRLEMPALALRDGALMALGEAAGMEEMKGRSFELVVANDYGDPQKAAKEARRLIEEEGVKAILGPVDSDCALAVVPVVTEARVPMITLAGHPALTRPINKYVFRGAMSDDTEGKLIADYATIMMGGGEIAIFYEDSSYGKAGMEVVRKRLRRVGREPVAVESYPSGGIDFSAQMARFKETGVKTIIVYGTLLDAQAVMQWIRMEGPEDAKVIASSGWASAQFLPIVPKGLDGVVVAGYTHLIPDSLIYLGPGRIVLSPIASGHYQTVTADPDADLFPVWAAFYKAFRSTYGRKPDISSGYGYSNILCILEALQRVNFDGTKLAESLENTENFQTVFHHLLSYHDEDHDGLRFINFSRYRDQHVEMATRDKSLDATKLRDRAIKVEAAGYRGGLFSLPVNSAAYFVIHMHYGYPRFMKESRAMGLYGGFRAEFNFYGMKYAYSGTLKKGKDQIIMVKMSFRSPDRTIAILDLEATKDKLAGRTKIETRPEEMRNEIEGVSYAEGLWSAYIRDGSKIVFAKGEVPLEDLKAAIKAALKANL